MAEIYRFIDFIVRHGNCGGSLIQFQQGLESVNALPFHIGKVLVMYDIRLDDYRGGHAHHETEEILIVLQGGCIVVMDDGKDRRSKVILHAESKEQDIRSSLLLYPHVWRELKEFKPNTILLVVANMKYDETDYIRDRATFEELAKDWRGLGGSWDG